MVIEDIMEAIGRYIEVIHTPEFKTHMGELSTRLITPIKTGYKNNEREEKIVENIANTINNFATVGHYLQNGGMFSLETYSVFIHNNQVVFKHGDNNIQRELGDIVFVTSVVYNKHKVFEKLTINQVKKGKKLKRYNARWDIDPEQLYLLSMFPKFTGVSGMFKGKNITFYDYSKCLGTYGLMYPSEGYFSLISAIELRKYLSLNGKKSINAKDVHEIIRASEKHCCYCCLIDPDFCYKIVKLILHWGYFYIPCIKYSCMDCFIPMLGTSCTAHDIYEFSEKYLMSLIGELMYTPDPNIIIYNVSVYRFFYDVIYKYLEKNPQYRDFIKFVSKYPHYDKPSHSNDPSMDPIDSYPEGGSFAIVYTTINLGGPEE